ncbi:MAG: AAA family ATPase, partial [Bacteroidota bacterium]
TMVLFETDYGMVPMHELSLGYKTLLAWTIDFAKGLIERYPDSDKPLDEPAICLIDEVDLHLHPKLQRDVLDFLQDTFSSTQFIMTAHSPLIAQSAGNGNVVLLKKEGDHVVAINDTANIQNWRVDQLLTSDLFGLTSGRAKTVESKMNERRELLSKKEFSEEDRERVSKLEKDMGEVPEWEDMDEKKAFDAIDMIADILKKKDD